MQRGYIWGPQAQLTYWSLQNYDHVPAVRAGRKAMCKQLAGLMMSQWDQHRHICENYNPHKDAMSNNDEGELIGEFLAARGYIGSWAVWSSWVKVQVATTLPQASAVRPT